MVLTGLYVAPHVQPQLGAAFSELLKQGGVMIAICLITRPIATLSKIRLGGLIRRRRDGRASPQ